MSSRGCGCIERACGVPVLMLAVIAAAGALLSMAAPHPEGAGASVAQRWAMGLVERLVDHGGPVVARIGRAPMEAG
jgi:hypothetical protein